MTPCFPGKLHSAANYVQEATGLELADLPRAAIVSLTRELYNGRRELADDSAAFGLLDVFRSYKHSEIEEHHNDDRPKV